MTVQPQTFGPWHFAVGTDVGRQRNHNEDAIAFHVSPGGADLLLAVFDGMGGHAAGDVASRGAAEILRRHFEVGATQDPRAVLFDALVDANDQIVRQGRANPDRAGMGSTAVVAWLRGKEAFVAHVGDSRMYQLRAGATVFRTRDHTKVSRMVEFGIISADEAARHPDANVVLRALGHMPEGGREPEKQPEVTNAAIGFKRGDALVLCSDGLYDLVSDADIAAALIGRTASASVLELIRLANERGGHDNISVAVAICGMPIVPWTTVARPPATPARPSAPVRNPAGPQGSVPAALGTGWSTHPGGASNRKRLARALAIGLALFAVVAAWLYLDPADDAVAEGAMGSTATATTTATDTATATEPAAAPATNSPHGAP